MFKNMYIVYEGRIWFVNDCLWLNVIGDTVSYVRLDIIDFDRMEQQKITIPVKDVVVY